MSKLIVMNTNDQQVLNIALQMETELLLMQDAVLFTNNKIEANKKFDNHKIYALKSDVEKRGLKDKVLEKVILVDMNKMVDLLFSGKTVINM